MKTILALILAFNMSTAFANSCPVEVVETQAVDYLSQELGIKYDVATKLWNVETKEVELDFFQANIETTQSQYLVGVEVDANCDAISYQLTNLTLKQCYDTCLTFHRPGPQLNSCIASCK
ncbi:hypothetical protein HBN50_01655 [Halobacteriovorax sp. GB3]|uniref:hypothetical protein n=1 Tax=Halobacteriovorax sp. GB3 TaxID=2719615 RepID=UPI0023604B93|nr:hypothetical protein [Halobacteriovorax sp. GB3]MDD0851775.1 hypothetical protein [Halobacteriovorax sp. GB3]